MSYIQRDYYYQMQVQLDKFVPRHAYAGFEPPLIDDTSYEADPLPTKPPRLVTWHNLVFEERKYLTNFVKKISFII